MSFSFYRNNMPAAEAATDVATDAMLPASIKSFLEVGIANLQRKYDSMVAIDITAYGHVFSADADNFEETTATIMVMPTKTVEEPAVQGDEA